MPKVLRSSADLSSLSCLAGLIFMSFITELEDLLPTSRGADLLRAGGAET